MSAFNGTLVIAELEPGRRWRLVEPIRYEAGDKGSGQWIIVPTGFETDGASIPVFMRIFLAVWGTYGRAACLHDYLYSILRRGEVYAGRDIWGVPQVHGAFSAWPYEKRRSKNFERASRQWADQEFYVAMRACGTRPTLAWIMWAAVRVFGAKAIK